MKERHNWLKRNPVTVARHMEHKYRVIFGRTVLMSDMHPIEQVLHYDSKKVSAERTCTSTLRFSCYGCTQNDENSD